MRRFTGDYTTGVSEPYPHGIVFHYFCGGRRGRAQGAISAEEFEQTLLYIGLNRVVPAHEWPRRAAAGSLQGTDVCITFDDGLREQHEIALPVLQRYGVSAFFFVYSSPMEGIPVKLELYRYIRNVGYGSLIDFYTAFDEAIARSPHARRCEEALHDFDHRRYLRQFSFHTPQDKKFRFLRDCVLSEDQYSTVMDSLLGELVASGTLDAQAVTTDLWMSDAELRELTSAGHVVGLHSYSHPTVMGRLSLDRQRDEYHRNFSHLSRTLGVRPWSMSHPCNSFNDDTLLVLRDLEITTGFRADMGPAANSYTWPRNDSAHLLRDLVQREAPPLGAVTC